MNIQAASRMLVAASLLSLGVVTQAFAFTECTRHVTNIYVESGQYVYATFDTGGPIYKTAATASTEDISLFYSLLLTANALGRQVKVRYPDANFNCLDPAGTSNWTGIWLLKAN